MVDKGKLLASVVSMRREHDVAELLRRHGGRGAFEWLIREFMGA
jgi:hypothetical protein